MVSASRSGPRRAVIYRLAPSPTTTKGAQNERADIEDYRPRNGNDPYSTILNALNEFLRSYLFLDWHPNA